MKRFLRFICKGFVAHLSTLPIQLTRKAGLALGSLALLTGTPAFAGTWSGPTYTVTSPTETTVLNGTTTTISASPDPSSPTQFYVSASNLNASCSISLQATYSATFTWTPANGDAPVLTQDYYGTVYSVLITGTGDNYTITYNTGWLGYDDPEEDGKSTSGNIYATAVQNSNNTYTLSFPSVTASDTMSKLPGAYGDWGGTLGLGFSASAVFH